MLFLFLLMICIFSFCFKWKNMIGMLLSLETFMLVMMLYILLCFLKTTIFYFVIVVLISEAVLGMSLLIMNIRFFGNDFSMNFFW